MFLETILASKRAEAAARAHARPLKLVEDAVAEVRPCRAFLKALQEPGLSVIGEIKRASPSRGPIQRNLDPTALARQYETGGCACISVLTDHYYFGAHEDDLALVKAAVSIPVLRKDFLLTEYQLWESRAMGADAVLLIVTALDPIQLEHLIELTDELGMCPLVEVHDEAELNTALRARAKVVGINNRDLRTFCVDLDTTRRLMPLLPSAVVGVSESGIKGPREAAAVRGWGADAVLVGASLITSRDPATLVRDLRVEGGDAPRSEVTMQMSESGLGATSDSTGT